MNLYYALIILFLFAAESKITKADIAGMNSPLTHSPDRPKKKKASSTKSLRSRRENDKEKSSAEDFKHISESKTQSYKTDMLTEKKFETEESEEEEGDSRGTKILSVFSVLQRLGTSDMQESQPDEKWGRNERSSEEWVERKDRKYSHKDHRRSGRRERSHSKEKTRRSVEMFDNDGLKDVRVIVISDDERENELKPMSDNRRSGDRKHKTHSQDRRDRYRDRDRDRERDRERDKDRDREREHGREHGRGRERDRDREKERDRGHYHKSKERQRHSRSRSRSHERHRRRKHEKSRSHSRERSSERTHKKKKRDRDRSKERDHDRYDKEHRRRSWSHSPHRKKEREKDEFGRDKHRHEQPDDRGSHKHRRYDKDKGEYNRRYDEDKGDYDRRYDDDKSEYSDTKKTRIIEAEVIVKKHEEKTHEPYNVIQTSLGLDENSDIDDDQSGAPDLPPIPPQTTAPPHRRSSLTLGEESKYDPAFPTGSASPQSMIQPQLPPEPQLEYMNQTFETNAQFQQPVVSIGNIEPLPTGQLEPIPTGPSGILGDGPILIPPPNMPPPNQPPGLPMPMGFGMLPPGYQPGMQPGMPPQRQILVNPVLMNRPPQIGQMQNPFPQLRWEVPPQGMIPVHNRFPGAVPRGPMVMNGGFDGMPPPPDNLQTFPPMIQGAPDPQTHPLHFQEQLLPSSVSMTVSHMRPETIPVSAQNSLPGTMIPIPPLNYSQPRPSLLGPGPVSISQPPPQLPEISQPTPDLDVQMGTMLNTQACMAMMTKPLPALNKNKDATGSIEDVFKVPLPPSSVNRRSKEVVDSSEVVDMDVDMDMSSPGEADGAIEVSSEFKENRRSSKSSSHERDVSPSDSQGPAMESSRKEKVTLFCRVEYCEYFIKTRK